MADSQSAKQDKPDATSWLGAVPRWGKIALIVLALILVAFAAQVALNSQSLIGSVHQRNFHDLDVAARGLETWPADMKLVAKNRFDGKGLGKPTNSEDGASPRYQYDSKGRLSLTKLTHPEIGEYEIVYDPGCISLAAPRSDTGTFRPGEKAGQGTVYFVSGRFQPTIKLPEPVEFVCFSTAVPLDRLINLHGAAPEFSHLLILAEDGSVVAQVGKSVLPVTQIGEFGPSAPIINVLTGRLLTDKQATSAPTQVKLGDAGGSEVVKKFAGESYRAYVKPFRIAGDACLPGGAAPAAKAAPSGQNSVPARVEGATPESGGANVKRLSGYCYAVGLMPESRLRSAWLSPPPVTLVGFGLVLLAVVALLSLMRLLLIGHAEAISFVEAGGILIGLQVATAVGALAVLFFAEVAAERQTSRNEAETVAVRMAQQADDEIEAVLARIRAVRLLGSATPPGGPATDGGQRDAAPGVACAGVGGKVFKCDPSGKYPREPDSEGEELPTVGSMASLIVLGPDGSRDPGASMVAFTADTINRLDVGGRDSFQALRRGETREFKIDAPVAAQPKFPLLGCDPVLDSGGGGQEMRYTLGQVRSQTDGTAKTVFALMCNPASAAAAPAPNAGDGVGAEPTLPDDKDATSTRSEQSLLTSTQLYAFLAPVIPDPLRFLVVDLDDPQLPVIFHHNPYRAGTENFADRIEGGANQLAAIRSMGASGATRPVQFSLRYDGAMTDFAAMPLGHANWAVLVYAPRDEVDIVAATTAARAIVDWLSIALLTIVTGGLLMMGFKPELWRDLWPDEADHKIYAGARNRLLIAAILVFGLVLEAAIGASPAWFGGLAALLFWWVGVAWFIWTLSQKPQTAKALSPLTERNYATLCQSMLLCISVIPMLAAWTDARTLSRELADTRRAAAAVRAIEERADRLVPVLRSSPLGADGATSKVPQGLPEMHDSDFATARASAAVTFARALSSTQSYLPEPNFRQCAVPEASRSWLCLDNFAQGRSQLPKTIALVRQRTDWDLPLLTWFGVAVAFAIVVAMVRFAVEHGLKAMMGFGVPLGAVKLRPFEADKIPARTLLVAPPTPVRRFFGWKSRSWKLDLADLLLATQDNELTDNRTKAQFEALLAAELDRRDEDGGVKPFRLIIVGLSLVLRDPARRRAALKLLEGADRAVESERLSGVVVISDFSPLERILDAFDNESGDGSKATAREELRWARLFQRFHTKQFSPVEKVDMQDARIRALISKRPMAAYGADYGTYALVQELRWLPATIIDSLTSDPPPPDELTGKKHNGKVWFPAQSDTYRKAYTGRVFEWASEQQMPSPAAAIDYLRTTLIEHYEQCWAAAALSERVVLDAIARGHFVNMHKAIALQSLVRRGLVILDPAPRLMNRSFAQFVLQIERPDTLREWRARQPRSSWLAARLPVLFAVIAGGVFLAVGSAESGQQLSALFAVLAAGGPTLASLVHRAVRPTG